LKRLNKKEGYCKKKWHMISSVMSVGCCYLEKSLALNEGLAEFKGKFCFSFTTKYQNWFPHRDKKNTDMVHMDSGQPTPAQECKLQTKKDKPKQSL